MKKKRLEKLLRRNGWHLEREGGNHEIWSDGIYIESIPRHRVLDEITAKRIIKRWNLE